MSDSLHILRRIRTEFDYKSYLELAVGVKYSGNGELRICCPNCGDQSYKCYVNDDKKYFNCFKCDFHSGNYDVFDMVSLIEDMPRAQAMLKLSREFVVTPLSWEEIIEQAKPMDVEEDYETTAPKITTLDAPPEGAVLLTDRTDPDQERFWEYLNVRGFTDAEIESVKTYCIPDERCYVFDANKKLRGNIGNRVLFPVYGGANKLVSWQARSIDGAMPKYFNAPDSDAGRTLWPFVPSRGSQCIVVEGIMDALAVRRHGFNSYATLGKKISIDQIDLLKNWGIKSVVMFWDKKDAKREMVKAIESLKLHFDEVLVPDLAKWPSDKDAGDTLAWEEGSEQMKDMLIHNLINVNSLEFVTWQM
jgi:DNA primase